MSEQRRENYRIALAQMNSGSSREENLAKAGEYIRQAAEQGASLIAFPEVVDYFGPSLKKHAVTEEEETIPFFCRQAEKYGIYIHCGSITEKQTEGNPKNTTFLVDPMGRICGRYSKLHMFDVNLTGGISYCESAEICPGDKIVTVPTELGTIGVAICYDIRFPELFRLMALQGAELMIVCANFSNQTGKAHWEPLLRARAIENSCYIAAVGQCGVKKSFHSHGHSMVIDPWGEVLASLQEEEGLLIAEIDRSRVEQIRQELPSLGNRRMDVYRLETLG